MSIRRANVLTAYLDTRIAMARLRTRADIERRQGKLWRKLAPTLTKTPALRTKAAAALNAFSIIEPAAIRARPADWNSLGLAADTIHAAAAGAEIDGTGEACAGVYAGFSTGSAGVRGVFLSSSAERARYLGQSLAKLLPADALLRRRRIGLCLRADNALYRDVANAGPFTFRYFPLAAGADERARDIQAFAPDIFIAPSHVLAELARFATAGAFSPPAFERLFYGAEPMSAAERAWIARVLGARPDPIYQATEGFLGAACKHGTLHLNEDSIVFEFERVHSSQRYRPIITDLRRTSQPIVRVRLDDLIEFLETPCPCGSSLRAIKPIEGRVSDVWRWGDSIIFPREIEDAMAATPPSIEWRASASHAGVTLACEDAHAQLAHAAITALLARAGASQPINMTSLFATGDAKRRRVRWADA